MPTRRPVRALAALAVSLVLAGVPAAAWAQPAPPPPINDLRPARPWTYVMGKGLMALAAVVLAACVLGYLAKAREFRANVRRGGSK